MDAVNPLASLATIALYGVVVLGAIHVYLAICLTVLAKKTNTTGSVLAWIPIVQAFYMFKIGRRSGAIGLLYFLPILNMAAFGIAWMSIAEARGKSPWLGVCALIPVLGILFVPWILAAGPATDPDSLWKEGMPTKCPKCGDNLEPGDTFCGGCGNPVSLAPARKRMSAGAMGVAALPVAAAFFAVAYFGGNKIADGLLAYNPPPRTAPAVPQSMASTLSYFPIDQRPGAPSKPQSVAVTNLDQGSASGSNSATWRTPNLPPGISRTDLQQVASAVSTSVYKGGTAPVTVNVASTRPRDTGAGVEIANKITAATSGTRQGVNVNAGNNGGLTGQRIDSAGKTIFVLWPESETGDIVVMIHTTTDGATDAEALAQGVGQAAQGSDSTLPGTSQGEPGEGISVLPAEPPAGLELVDVQTQTLDGFLAGEPDAPNSKEMIAFVKQTFGWALPEKVTNAIYLDSGSKAWDASVLDYGRADRAWVMEKFLGDSATGSKEPIDAAGFTGFMNKVDRHWVAVARKGPYVILCEAPDDADPKTLTKLIEGLQI